MTKIPLKQGTWKSTTAKTKKLSNRTIRSQQTQQTIKNVLARAIEGKAKTWTTVACVAQVPDMIWREHREHWELRTLWQRTVCRPSPWYDIKSWRTLSEWSHAKPRDMIQCFGQTWHSLYYFIWYKHDTFWGNYAHILFSLFKLLPKKLRVYDEKAIKFLWHVQIGASLQFKPQPTNSFHGLHHF